jgi:hypothetical protein
MSRSPSMALASVQPRFRPSDINATDRAAGCCWRARYTASTMISASKNCLARRESERDFAKYKIANLPTATAQMRCIGMALLIPLSYGLGVRLFAFVLFDGTCKGKYISYFDGVIFSQVSKRYPRRSAVISTHFRLFFLLFLGSDAILPADRDANRLRHAANTSRTQLARCASAIRPAARVRTCGANSPLRQIALSFRAALRAGNSTRLRRSIEGAKRSEFGHLVRFAYGLQKDISAVSAAVDTSWSTGQVEGQIYDDQTSNVWPCGF